MKRKLKRNKKRFSKYGSKTSGPSAQVMMDMNRAVALHQAGDLVKAEQMYRSILEKDSKNADALNLLGAIAIKHENFLEAESLCRQAVKLHSDRPAYFCNLGIALKGLGKIDEAITVQQKTIALDQNFADGLFNLGLLYWKKGQLEKALEKFQAASVMVKGDYMLHLNIGMICEQLNRLDEAMEQVEKAHNIKKNAPQVVLLKARLMRRKGEFEEAVTLLSAVVIPEHDIPFAQSIHHEMGNLYDRLGHSGKAFFHYSEANRFGKQNKVAHDADKERYFRRINSLCNVFSESWVASWTDGGESETNQVPAFLVGFPRSGTTLLDQVLDSHPQLQVVEEKINLEKIILEGLADLPGGYPEGLAGLNLSQLAGLRVRYFSEVEKFIQPKPGCQLVDKFPLSIVDVGFIHRLFPSAKIILALRHPCDVVLSNFMQLFEINDAMVQFLTLQDTARFYDQVMSLWRRYESVLPLAYHQVKYEDLLDDFSGEAARLLKFLGQPWDDAVLKYYVHAGKRQISTPSYHQVSKPLYKTSQYRWVRYKDHLVPVLDILRPHIKYFGYELNDI